MINSFNFWGLIISVFSFGAFDIFLSIIFGYVTIKESLFCWENINLFEYNSFVEDTKNKSLKSFKNSGRHALHKETDFKYKR